MTFLFLWLWFGIGIGMACDFRQGYKEQATWYGFIIVAILSPIFFPTFLGWAVCKIIQKEDRR